MDVRRCDPSRGLVRGDGYAALPGGLAAGRRLGPVRILGAGHVRGCGDELESTWGRVVLPLGKPVKRANVPGEIGTRAIEYEHAEPGVRQGQ